jgi:hypothetical protein
MRVMLEGRLCFPLTEDCEVPSQHKMIFFGSASTASAMVAVDIGATELVSYNKKSLVARKNGEQLS